MDTPPSHVPVLLEQVMRALDPARCRVVVDATYGRGGHAAAILELLDELAELVLIDRDAEAVEHARLRWGELENVHVIHGPFSCIGRELEKRGMHGRVDAILFDFGLSSAQLDQPQRGFSFRHDGPLDMRMDNSRGQTAREWIQKVRESELARALREFGEERFSRRIARAIKQEIGEGGLRTTGDLARVVCASVPGTERHKHPATRTFQAIRIAVNGELEEIERVLPMALDALAPGGRLAVISFHSLEDRLVKRFFRFQEKGDPYPPGLPVPASMLKPGLEPLGRPVRPDAREIACNPRARSAVLRVARKAARQVS